MGLGRLLDAAVQIHYCAGAMCQLDPAMRAELRQVADRLNELTTAMRRYPLTDPRTSVVR